MTNRTRPGARARALGLALAAALAHGTAVAQTAVAQAAVHTATEGLNIGMVDGPREQSFEQIVGVEVARDGSIVVLDSGDGSIRVFDAEGRFLRRFGGAGEGPHEFRFIGAAALAADTLIVLDRAGGKLVYFGLDGTLIDTRPTSFLVSLHGFPVRLRALRGGDLVLETASGCSLPRREGSDTLWRLLLIPRGGEDPTELHVAGRGGALAVYGAPQPTFCAILPLPFRAGPVTAVRPDGTIAFGTGETTRVQVFDRPAAGSGSGGWLRGSPRQVLELAGDRRPLTRAEQSAWRDSVLAERAGDEAPRDIARRFREVVGEVEYPERWPAYDRLIYDSTGDLWARRPAPIGAAAAEWEVLRPDGTRRGTVSLPARLEVHIVADGRVYGVIAGEWDEQRVKRYDVQWN